MESIRSLIKERIKSCISCNENQCPIIKERLDHHVLSHHATSTSRTRSCQPIKFHHKSSGLQMPSESNISLIKLEVQTSTSELSLNQTSKRKFKNNYKEELKELLLEWSNTLPIVTEDQENAKQNELNELLEKIYELYPEKNEEHYDLKLNKELDNFLNSIRTEANDELDMYTLREMFLNKIHDLNKKMMNSDVKATKRTNKSGENRFETKDIAVSTIDVKNQFEYPRALYNDTSAQISSLSTPEEISTDKHDNIKYTDKKYVDTQIQNSLTNNMPSYEDIYEHKKVERNDSIIIFKQNILDWILELRNEGTINIEIKNLTPLVEDFFNRLKPILQTKTYISDSKLLLRGEILNFLLKNMGYKDTSKSTPNIAHLNKLADSLAKSLLIEKNHRMIQSVFFQNKINKDFGISNKENMIILRSIYDMVVKTLVNYGIYSDRLINNMTKCILENMESININKSQYLKQQLSTTLKYSTGLPQHDVNAIVDDIIDDIVTINNYFDFNENVNEIRYDQVISVYKSENELRGQSNNSNTSNRRRSSILKKKLSKVKLEEKNYIKDIKAVIITWLDILPVDLQIPKNKKKRETFVDNLATDILDQVKLDKLSEVSNEKDKYVSFFIYRWLNRLEYFENIDEAKPFVDQLVEMLKGVPEPPGIISNNKLLLSPIHTNKNTPSCPEIKEQLKILKNEIISLVNNLSPNIILIKDNVNKTKLIDDLVLKIQHLITENQTLNDISKAIDISLKEIINPKEKETKLQLSKKITDSVKKILGKGNLSVVSTRPTDNKMEATESILKDYIAKYLEHSDDPEDSIARDAFSILLKSELNKLNSSLDLTNVDLTKSYHQEEAIIEKLSRELESINIITDWLKILPLQDTLNQIDRRVLALLINKLVIEINNLDESMMCSSNENEYNKYLTALINQFSEQLPISNPYRRNVNSLIDNLCTKLVVLRKTKAYCQFTNQTLSATSDSITVHNLTNFIEEYIHKNGNKMSEDDLKLEACILRFLELIDKKEVENLTTQSKSEGTKLANKTKLQNATARRFNIELGYAYEISQWLKNLPVQPLSDKESQNQIANMISILAEKISEVQTDYKDTSEIDSGLVDYITNWINALRLDSSKEIMLPVAVQQLLNRIVRVNIDKHQSHKNKEESQKNNIPSKIINSHEDDLGMVVINEIEKWCSNLPIESDNKDTERELKQNVATKLYQKVGELNMNPEYFNNNLLYQELLAEEIEKILDNLPQNCKLESVKDELKRQLLKTVTDKRNEIKEKTSATEYKHDLERTIEMSMPYPIPIYQEDSPGFKIYKDRFAEIFILENFDHANDAKKIKYENKIKNEIDKYFRDVQMRNSIPVTKEQIHNELYSALFGVPLPNESSITEEVEEIKTRCEIEEWFETLPLREANGVGELLEWDQILAMLAKRLREMEKYEQGRDEKMHKEISKWLLRLPLLPGEETNIDIFAHALQIRLKESQQDRKCVTVDMNASHQTTTNDKIENEKIFPNNQVSTSSNSKDTWYTPPSYSVPVFCRTTASKDVKKPADSIIEIVEGWCSQLPLPANTVQEKEKFKVLKENIAISIIMKITELNMNPETFEDDFLYDGLLDDELENLLSTFPTPYEFQESKDIKKYQLIKEIKAIKPLIQEEKARYEYRRGIKNTIDNVLKTPQNKNNETSIALASVTDEIADSYIVYNYHKNDNEGSQMKEKIDKSVEKFFSLVKYEGDIHDLTTNPSDPLMKRNQLICELSKISTPNESVIIKELKEIDMKFEITKFFNKLSLPQSIEKIAIKNQVKSTLAKRLTDLEKIGYTSKNCHKIKTELIKYLKKIDDNIESEKVESFIETLKSTQPNRNSISRSSRENSSNVAQKQNFETSLGVTQSNLSHQNTKNEQWLSLLPVTPQNENTKEFSQDKMNTTTTSYKNFESGPLISSSTNTDQSMQRLELKNDQNKLHRNQNSRLQSVSGNNSACQNYSQDQTSQDILKLPETNHLRGHNVHDIKSQPPSQYNPTYPPGQSSSNLDYIRHQDGYRNQFDTSPFLQHQRQSSEGPQPVRNRHAESSFQRTPNNLEPDLQVNSDILKRQNSASHKHGFADPTELSNDKSMPCQNLEAPSPCTSHPLSSTARISQKPISYTNIRRTCRRPSITIFSPSYLEPEVSESQYDRAQIEKSRPELSDEENIQCSCAKKNKQMQESHGSVQRRKYCKFCNRVHPFYCGVYRYPDYHFY